MNIVVIYIFCILGIVSRTLLPFFQTLRDEPNTKWDNKFLVPPVASLVINLMIAPFVFRELPAGADWVQLISSVGVCRTSAVKWLSPLGIFQHSMD